MASLPVHRVCGARGYRRSIGLRERHDLDAAVRLQTGDETIARQVRRALRDRILLAKTACIDQIGGGGPLDQERPDRLGAALRQTHVVARRSETVCIAAYFDAPELHRAQLRGDVADL